MKAGDVINGYLILEDFKVVGAGLSKWTFAARDGREYFIKEFLSPTYPDDDAPGSDATKPKKRAHCASRAPGTSPSSRDLVDRMLALQPAERPTVGEVHATLMTIRPSPGAEAVPPPAPTVLRGRGLHAVRGRPAPAPPRAPTRTPEPAVGEPRAPEPTATGGVGKLLHKLADRGSR